MGRRVLKRRKVAKKAPEEELRRDVLREARKAVNLLELELEDLYSVLGAHLQAAQAASRLVKVKVPRGVDKRTAFLRALSLIAETPLKTGKEFIQRYWGRLLKEACPWWEENKEKYEGRALIANLALAIAPRLPQMWRTPAILTAISSILVRAGLDELCAEMPERPPLVEEKVEEVVEEVEEKPEEVVEEERPVEEKPEEEVEEKTEVEEKPEETPF